MHGRRLSALLLSLLLLLPALGWSAVTFEGANALTEASQKVKGIRYVATAATITNHGAAATVGSAAWCAAQTGDVIEFPADKTYVFGTNWTPIGKTLIVRRDAILSPSVGITVDLSGCTVYTEAATWTGGAGTVTPGTMIGQGLRDVFASTDADKGGNLVRTQGGGTVGDALPWVVDPSVTSDHAVAATVGTLAYALANASAGQTIRVPARATAYAIGTPGVTSALDGIRIECEPGATFQPSGTGYNALTLTGDDVSLTGCEFLGEGTNVLQSTTANARGLVSLEGDRPRVQHCTFRDGETFHLQIKGVDAQITDNDFVGGPYYATAAELGGATWYYGILLYLGQADGVRISLNRFRVGADGGKAVQWIVSGTDTDALTRAQITNNVFGSAYQHAMYVTMAGGIVANNYLFDAALKVEQLEDGASTQGPVIESNVLSFADPFALNKKGITVVAPHYAQIRSNLIMGANVTGISLTDPFSETTPEIIGNVVEGNVILNTVQGAIGYTGALLSDDSYGIDVDPNNDKESSPGVPVATKVQNNTILNNLIVNTGTDGVGNNYGVRIVGEAADVASNTGNVVAGNRVIDCQEVGYYFTNLTGLRFTENRASGLGLAGTASPCVQTSGVVGSEFARNRCDGTGGGMSYAFREDAAGANANRYVSNEAIAPATATFRLTNFGTNNYVSGNHLGTLAPNVYSTAGDRTIALADLYSDVLLRDPAGGNRTDTLAAVSTLDDDLFPVDGAERTVLYCNTADAAETITIGGSTGWSVLKNEGASDLVIGQGECATLWMVRTSSTAIRALLQKFN